MMRWRTALAVVAVAVVSMTTASWNSASASASSALAGSSASSAAAASGTIVGQQSGRCVDAQGAGTANGTVVQIYDCNGTAAQQWQVRSDGSILNPSSGRCV